MVSVTKQMSFVSFKNRIVLLKNYNLFLLCLQIIYIYIYIYIYIIMSCRLHGYPWPSLATSPYRSSLLAGLQGYIPYPNIAAVCMFELVVLLLLDHMKGSIGVHQLWARLCFSSLCPACLVRLTLIVFVMGGRWPTCHNSCLELFKYQFYGKKNSLMRHRRNKGSLFFFFRIFKDIVIVF